MMQRKLAGLSRTELWGTAPRFADAVGRKPALAAAAAAAMASAAAEDAARRSGGRWDAGRALDSAPYEKMDTLTSFGGG
jgi:hypothetical protein